MRNVRWCACLLLLIFSVGLAVAYGVRPVHAQTTQAGADLVLVFDASGSMWGQVQKQPKIEIARRVLKQVLAKVPETTAVGLLLYGHRSKTDCDDIETVVAPGTKDRTAVLKAIDSVQPKGKTPIFGSLQKVIGLLRARETATTVVLISDGIETCGGDACKLVRDTRGAGIKFVMHVVGFDLGEVDVSQLECAAQAGGGLYFTAANADELSAALDQAVNMTPETPSGKLSMKTTADGKLTDVLLTVSKSEGGEVVTRSRTYTSPESNPRILPLPDGRYDVLAESVQTSGKPSQRLAGIEIRDGATVEKSIDFSTGTLRVGVTRNGKLSDATVNVYRAGTREPAGAGRTYRSAESNPREIRLPSGVYDVEIHSVEIEGKPSMRWEAVEVGGSTPVERQHEFTTATLRIGVSSGGKLVDAVVAVNLPEGGQAVAQGRTYMSPSSNPKSFELGVGEYVVSVNPVKPKDLQPAKFEARLEAGATVEHKIDLLPK